MGKFTVRFQIDVNVDVPIDIEDNNLISKNVIDVLDKNQYNDIVSVALSEVNAINSHAVEILYEPDSSTDKAQPNNIAIYVEDWFDDHTAENCYPSPYDRIKDLQAMADGNNPEMVRDCIEDLDYDTENIDVEAVTHQLCNLARNRLSWYVRL